MTEDRVTLSELHPLEGSMVMQDSQSADGAHAERQFIQKVEEAVERGMTYADAANAIALAEPELYRAYRNGAFIDGRV